MTTDSSLTFVLAATALALVPGPTDTVIISNPKMLMLFGALIPPFISQGGEVARYTVMLGLIFAGIAVTRDTAYALMAGQAGAWLSEKRIRGLEITSGCCLVGGAAWMVLKGK